MRHFSTAHGSHCYLRSFKTKCPNCGADVLYWECTHGCKVFFEYPPYGKLIKHICKKRRHKNVKKEYKNIVKTPKGLLENSNVYCPACGKAFDNEASLHNHIQEKKKFDYYHKILISSINNDEAKKTKLEETKDQQKEDQYKPKFGKINFKNKNK
jgi:hypothetical protein